MYYNMVYSVHVLYLTPVILVWLLGYSTKNNAPLGYLQDCIKLI